MAYMCQENKAKLAPGIKRVLANYGLKGSLRVSGNSTLCLTITSGDLDFIGNFVEVLRNEVATMDKTDHRTRWMHDSISQTLVSQTISVNEYHLKKQFTGRCLAALSELLDAMNVGNWDKSDIQTDYFNIGWYVSMNVGKMGKPYQLNSHRKVA